MPDFKSLQEIEKYINKDSKGITYVLNQPDIKNKLQDAAKRLEEILHQELENYYSSYTPVVYERTYNLLNSLRVSPLVQTGNQISISVYFDQDMATHPSIFGGEDGFVPILLDQGWQWKNGMQIHHLSTYDGFHFIDKSIQRFNQENPYGFKITRQGNHNGQDIY